MGLNLIVFKLLGSRVFTSNESPGPKQTILNINIMKLDLFKSRTNI